MKFLLSIVGLSCLGLGGLLAQEESRAGAGVATKGSVIPEAYTPARYRPTWATSPFLRRSGPAAPDLATAPEWRLTGMYQDVDGGVAVTVQNIRTGQFRRVTSGGGGSGFKLIGSHFSRHRDQAYVEIEKDGERAVVKYDGSVVKGS